MGRRALKHIARDAAKIRSSIDAGEQATPAEAQPDATATGLTADEIVTLNIGAPGALVELIDFRREMMRIYRLACQGKIPVSLATKAVWLVDRGRIAKLDEEKLVLAQKNGGGLAPFTGMEILPPAKTDDTEAT